MKKSLMMLAALSLMGTATGCDDDNWYADWYDTTPVVESAEPAYSSYLEFRPETLDAGFVGCLDMSNEDDQALITAFFYDPADMPAFFWFWYDYIEFEGFAGAGTSTIAWDGGVVEPAYVESGIDYGAPAYDTETGTFSDFFYSDSIHEVADCSEPVPDTFVHTIVVSDFSTAGYSIAYTFVESTL